MNNILFEFAFIVFDLIPLVMSCSTLFPILKITHIIRNSAINFVALPIGQIIMPLSSISHFLGCQCTISLGLVHFHLAFIKCAIFLNKEGVPALGRALFKTPFVYRAVIVDETTTSMGQTVFPLSVIIGGVGKKVIQTQFGSLSLADVGDSQIGVGLLSRTKISLILGLISINCLTAFANLGSGASPSMVLKSVMVVLSQLFLTPQHDQQYACPIIINKWAPFSIFNFRMPHLISLHSPARLLEVHSDMPQITHVLVCETNEQAIKAKETFIRLNKCCGVWGQISDNIAKVSINDVELASTSNELEQAQRLKSLLAAIEQVSDCDNKRVPSLSEGFYYYSPSLRKMLFYRLVSENTEEQSQHLKNINNIHGVQVFGIFAYLLCYSSNIKQYIHNWRQLALKKQELRPIPQLNTKTGLFITSLLNKDLPTLKIALHTLQITIERILWATNHAGNSAKCSPNQVKYQQEPRIGIKNQSPRRLKQSNSMTNLSSSNRSRKYKKVSPHLKNEKVLKQAFVKSSVSFWNGKMTNTFNSTAKASGLLGNSKNMSANWQRETAIMDSFAKINQFNMQKSVINQSELLELLQKKQKSRKINAFESRGNCQSLPQEKSDNPTNCNRLQINFVQKPKRQMKLHPQNFEITIHPEKKFRSQKLVSTVFSVNEKPCLIPREIKGLVQSKQSQKQILRSESVKKIKQSCSQVKENAPQVSGYVTNTLFLYESIQILCNEKPLRRFWLISLYAMYLFYYTDIFTPSATQPEAQANHKTNLLSMATRLEQYKTNPEFVKQLDSKNIEDINLLLSQAKNLDSSEKNQNQEICLRVLKKQFQKNKSEITKNKGELIKTNRFKIFLIYMIRLAICISVVGGVKEDHCGVGDFSRYQKVIMDEKKQDNEIDLLAELRNCEQLF